MSDRTPLVVATQTGKHKPKIKDGNLFITKTLLRRHINRWGEHGLERLATFNEEMKPWTEADEVALQAEFKRLKEEHRGSE